MKKELFERFIKKYHLNGVINGVHWTTENGTLRVTAMESQRKLFSNAILKHFDGFDDAEFRVKDTKKLLTMLKSLPPENVSFDFVKDSSGEVKALSFSASKYEMRYATWSSDDIDPVPTMKSIPPWNAAIILDDEFTDWFFRAYAAMGDKDTLLTLVMSQRTGSLEVVMNYRHQGYYNSLYFTPDTLNDADRVVHPVSFHANHLKEVLKANPEFKDPVLHVADAGLASIAFSEDDLDSEYYFIKIDVED